MICIYILVMAWQRTGDKPLSGPMTAQFTDPLQWRHNGRDSVSNHQPHDCLLKRLFRCRSRKTSKLRVTGLCAGNSPVTGEFPAQMASNAENVSIWCRHHAYIHRWALNHLPVDKTAAVSQTIFSHVFMWMKGFVFWLKFHWNYSPGVQLADNPALA